MRSLPTSKIATAYLSIAASSAVATVATLAAGVLLARLLSVEDRGLVALIVYWASMAAAFGNFSFPHAFVKENNEQEKPLPRRTSTILLLAVFTAIASSAIACGLVFAFPERFIGAGWQLAALSIAIFIFINHINRAMISIEQSALNFGRIAIEQSVLPLLYCSLLVAAALFGELTAVVAIAIFLVSRIPLLLVRLWRSRGHLIAPFDWLFARRSVVTGGRFHAISVIRFLNEQADRFVVSIQWSMVGIGLFAVGYSAVGATYGLVSQALNQVTLPSATKMQPEETAEHLARSLRITTILLIAGMIPLLLAAPLLIPFVFGEAYTDAVLITQVLAIALLPAPLIAQTDAVFRARGMVRQAMLLHGIAFVLFILGWVTFGYAEIVSLGLMLAASRLIALGVTLASAQGEFAKMSLWDCIRWRGDDFRTIFETVWGVFRGIVKRVSR